MNALEGRVERIEATYRVVTPMFMSGAEQSKAELRLPNTAFAEGG
jgi:CRISPR/Cas system CMR-associated protein Cmr1 (group 7 of RAMP superfamily)